MKKLILFGDSLIANFGRRETETIELKTNYDVYNCATGGWDTNHGVNKAPYIAQLKPDVVVFSFGTNDSTPDRLLEIETVTENTRKIIEIFNGSKMIFLLPPPIHEERQEPGRNRSNAVINQYALAIKSVLTEKSVTYIDSWDIFKKMFDAGQDYHEEDGVHFNDLGYQTLIGEIVTVVNESN